VPFKENKTTFKASERRMSKRNHLSSPKESSPESRRLRKFYFFLIRGK
jgi:hypothetical protein